MAEQLREFVEPVLSADRKLYRAQAVGRAMPDGMWEGWVYELSDEPKAVLDRLPQNALIELIVAGVRDHTFTR